MSGDSSIPDTPKGSRRNPDRPVCRVGKIAQMPYVVRMELNRRMLDGEFGATLLEWLNGLPEIQQLIAKRFKGQPVSSENLSSWREGGYAEWLKANRFQNN